MSSSDIAVSVRGLGKSYTIAHQAGDTPNTMAEAMLARLRHPLRRTPKETFWALQDVDFDIKAGEVVGIVGRNGAGKSTLLKLLSRITEPTTGTIDLVGRVGSLLEVGTGFHPELTGRENVFLNGAILGMTKAEIRQQFDAIVDFAGVEQFLDTPVKRYSSGMYVRLAFAVAAHLDSDILIMDEVLAVGDSAFQKKCLGKMKEVSTEEGRTVLFVSHNIASIGALCTRCVFLADGRVALAADTATVISHYLNVAEVAGSATFDVAKKPGSSLVLADCAVVNASGEIGGAIGVNDPFTIRLGVLCRRPVEGAEVSVRVETAAEVPVFSTSLSDGGAEAYRFEPGRHTFEVPVPGHFLVPGRYNLVVGLHRPNIEMFDSVTAAVSFEIEEVGSNMSKYSGTNYGVVLVDFDWTVVDCPRRLHSELAR